MTAPPTLPHGIGPHDGRERALLLAGDKHVAYFSGYEPDWLPDFMAACSDAFGWVTWQDAFRERVFISHVVFRRGHEERADELIALLTASPARWDAAYERRIGELLSYSPAEIDAWITWIMRER